MHFCSGDQCVINDTSLFLRSLVCVYLVKWFFIEVVKILLQCFTTSYSTELIFLKGLWVWPKLFTEVQPNQCEVSEGTIYAAELWDSEIVEKKRKGIFRLEADFWDHYFKVEKFHLDIMENMPACLWTVWDFKSKNFLFMWKSVMKLSRTVVEPLETEAFNWFSYQLYSLMLMSFTWL